MITADIRIHFAGRYIGSPYWIERSQLIEIQKLSGMNRSRATQNRRKALEEYLRANNMTLADYEALEEASNRPFHMSHGKIIIPADRFLSFLGATCDEARAAQRPCDKRQVRSRFMATDFVTDKTKPDGVWHHFVTVSSGTGQKLSNQRGERQDAFIENFEARGSLTFDEQFINAETLRNAILWGGQFVGIGASRPMGMGRFALTHFATRAAALDPAPVLLAAE